MTQDIYFEIIDYIGKQIAGSDLGSGLSLENNVFAVGGCVRDVVMGNEINDIDIAVPIPDGGYKLGKFLENKGLLKHGLVNYPAYSVCKFVLKEYPDVEIEAVQTRKEKYADKESRNPVTAFGTIKDDCYRRDLTINSLYMSISTKEILDLTGRGISDIKNRIAMTPLEPDETFDDDPLRMMRVIRFASRFGLYIDDKVYQSIIKYRKRLYIICRERIHDEFVKMLKDKACGVAVQYMFETNLIETVFTTIHHTRVKPSFVIDNISDLKNAFDDYRVILSAVLLMYYDFENAETYGMRLKSDLKMSNADISFCMKIIKMYLQIVDWCYHPPKLKKEIYQVFYECGDSNVYLIAKTIARIINVMHYKNLYHMCIDKDVYNNIYGVNGQVNFFKYQLPISGSDVMDKLNMEPGKEVKTVLNKLLDIVFENPKLYNKPDEIWKEYEENGN